MNVAETPLFKQQIDEMMSDWGYEYNEEYHTYVPGSFAAGELALTCPVRGEENVTAIVLFRLFDHIGIPPDLLNTAWRKYML